MTTQTQIKKNTSVCKHTIAFSAFATVMSLSMWVAVDCHEQGYKFSGPICDEYSKHAAYAGLLMMILTSSTSGLIYTVYNNASQNNQALFNCCKSDDTDAGNVTNETLLPSGQKNGNSSA